MAKPFYQQFDVPEEVMEEALNVLEQAASTGRIRKGTNESTKAIERGIAKLVYIAEDVNPPEIVAHLPLLCEERNITYLYVPDKNRLGISSGISVNAASACIVEAGDAETLVQEISSRLKKIREGG